MAVAIDDFAEVPTGFHVGVEVIVFADHDEKIARGLRTVTAATTERPSFLSAVANAGAGDDRPKRLD